MIVKLTLPLVLIPLIVHLFLNNLTRDLKCLRITSPCENLFPTAIYIQDNKGASHLILSKFRFMNKIPRVFFFLGTLTRIHDADSKPREADTNFEHESRGRISRRIKFTLTILKRDLQRREYERT